MLSSLAASTKDGRPAPYILMLVPHDPKADPRVGWATELCANFAKTHVIGMMNWSDRYPRLEYDQQAYIERCFLQDYLSLPTRVICKIGGLLTLHGTTDRFRDRNSRRLDDDFTPLVPETSSPGQTGWVHKVKQLIKKVGRRTDNSIGSVFYTLSTALSTYQLVSTMWKRVRGITEKPGLIVCHDLFALVSAIRLKRRFGCPVIYDCHECWPEADNICPQWATSFWARYERKYIRQADAVITVSPPLTEYLKQLYGLKRIICVPNWTPWDQNGPVQQVRPASTPVKFLLQGGLSPGRGVKMLLDTWSKMNDPRAVLYVRGPESSYTSQLRSLYAEASQKGSIVFLDSVNEEELVQAASFADVGIIPYPPINKNHEYCCPNKFSQYLQAGLAILSTETDFIGPEIRRVQCGRTFDAYNSEDLVRQVQAFCDDPAYLQQCKENGLQAGKTQHHWAAVSDSYRDLIDELLVREPPSLSTPASFAKAG